jgi:hypothetical protein
MGLAPDGVYFWRVRGLSSNGTIGPWSIVRKITLDTTPPAPPALSMPLAAAISNGNPTFSWTKPAGVAQTRLEIMVGGCGVFIPDFTGPWQTTTTLKPTTLQFP